MPASATSLDLRASDAERDAAIDQLRHHCADGRITADELSERIDAVFAAEIRRDLGPPLNDLPSPGASPEPPPPAHRRPPAPLGAPIAAVLIVGLVTVGAVTGAWWLLWLLWPLIHWTKASHRHGRATLT